MSNGSDTGSDTPTQSNDRSTTSFKPTSEAGSGINKPTATSPPNDTPGDSSPSNDASGNNGTGGSGSENTDNGGQSGGPNSVASQLIETVLGGSDGSGTTLNAAAGSNDGLNVGVDGNNLGGLEINADQSQDGLNIIVDGEASDGSLVGLAGLEDLGRLAGGTESLIDVDFDQDDGQTAAILDVAGSSDGNAQAAVLGSDITAGSSFDIPDSSGLIDGISEDSNLLG
jgi:hypothetical protein